MIRIINGDCRDVLKTLPDASVQCCVTSPPYFGLRDYGVEGQIGLEPSPDEFIAELIAVFREVRRALRTDGTCWLNLGDSYNAYNGNRGASRGLSAAVNEVMPSLPSGAGLTCKTLANKQLLMIPARVAIALQADGWWLRSDIIWVKPNPMPESVTDRPTSSHEHVFLLTKSARYFYDADAVREPMAAASISRLAQDVESQAGNLRANGGAKTNGPMKAVAKGNAKTFRGGGAYTQGRSFNNNAIVDRDSRGNEPNESGSRNIRNVWTIATQPYAEAHFATFPPELAERCIKAGSREGDTILDPFSGAGTTALVADRLRRDAIGIELNPAYTALSTQRITADAGLFAEVSA